LIAGFGELVATRRLQLFDGLRRLAGVKREQRAQCRQVVRLHRRVLGVALLEIGRERLRLRHVARQRQRHGGRVLRVAASRSL